VCHSLALGFERVIEWFSPLPSVVGSLLLSLHAGPLPILQSKTLRMEPTEFLHAGQLIGLLPWFSVDEKVPQSLETGSLDPSDRFSEKYYL